MTLTQTEARIRRRMVVAAPRVRMTLDLSEVVGAGTVRSESLIEFDSAGCGQTAFLDCALPIVEATWNDRQLRGPDVAGSRILLRDVRPSNTLRVRTEWTTGGTCGLHVVEDTGETYVWTLLEPDLAHRTWPCFDQPDIKATYELSVLVPSSWRVYSNAALVAQTTASPGVSLWTFAPTPPLAPYLVSINAGPYEEIVEDEAGLSLTLACPRRHLALLRRDCARWTQTTRKGIAWLSASLGCEYPERSYVQVFTPGMYGAMEHYACITVALSYLQPSAPLEDDWLIMEHVLLHELAHMWFGNIVTPTWWDDLWLNESLAEWASYTAQAEITENSDCWQVYTITSRRNALRIDQGEGTRAVRAPAATAEVAASRFDAVTYAKGATALRQLEFVLGPQRWRSALALLLARCGGRDASWTDFCEVVSAAAPDFDVRSWSHGWLDSPGMDTLHQTEVRVSETSRRVRLRLEGPATTTGQRRTHSVLVRLQDLAPGQTTVGRQESVHLAPGDEWWTDVTGDIVVVANDEDRSYVRVCPDGATLGRLRRHLCDLPDAATSAVVVNLLWDQVVNGTLAALDFCSDVTQLLSVTSAPATFEALLFGTEEIARFWVSDPQVPGAFDILTETCLTAAQDLGRGEARDLAGHRAALALRFAATFAGTDAQVTTVREMMLRHGGRHRREDIVWRLALRLASMGKEPEALDLAREHVPPDMTDADFVTIVRGALPSQASRRSAWEALRQGRVPYRMMRALSQHLWMPAPKGVLDPLARSFVDLATHYTGTSRPNRRPMNRLEATLLFPLRGLGEEDVHRLETWVANGDASTDVTSVVAERLREYQRMVDARRISTHARSAGPDA